jgi:hypothetical protein
LWAPKAGALPGCVPKTFPDEIFSSIDNEIKGRFDFCEPGTCFEDKFGLT